MSGFEVSSALYAEVLHFYGRQMRALDRGDFARYAATFTADGVFQHSPGLPPARTRAGIVAALEDFHRRFRDDPVQRRHWFNHVELDLAADGSIISTCYALIITTRPGGRPDVGPSCEVHDVLVREAGGLLTRSRRVEHDKDFTATPPEAAAVTTA